MLAKIFVILFLFGVAYADDPTFAVPPQWDASMIITSIPSDFPIPIPGHFWFDSPNQFYRIDIDVVGMQFKTIIDFNQMVYATITTMNGETNCNLNSMDPSADPNSFVPHYQGRDSQNNCNIFKLTNPDNPLDPSYINFCITSNQLLLYIKIYTKDGHDSPKETDIIFSNHRIGQAPSGTFTIPSDCPQVSDSSFGGNGNNNDNGNDNYYGNGYARRNRRMKRMVSKKSQSTFHVMRQLADAVTKPIKTK